MTWIFWSPLVATSLHIFEEFVYPGKFKEWYVLYKPGIKKSISNRFLILINAGLLILCYDIGALGSSKIGIELWLAVMAMLAANGIWHIKGAVKTRGYSPGVITPSIIYLPLTIYGYILFLSTGQVNIFIALIAFAVGVSYQFWSNLFHRFRARSKEQ